MAQQQTRFTTEGLVLKEASVGESDRLVTLMTREHGIIKAFAAGAKNITSKKGAATALLTYSSFTVLQKNGTNRIYEATPITSFFSMGSDITVLALSQYICELALVFGQEGTANEELLRLVLNSLHFLIKEKRDPYLIKAITELRIAVLGGYTPDLVACSQCGEFESDLMYFDLSNGTLCCGECSVLKEGIPLSRTMLSAMRHIVYSKFEKLYSFQIPEDSAFMLSNVIERFITLQTDYNFKTLEFFNAVKEK